MIDTILGLIIFSVEAVAALIASTIVVYILARAASAAYFMSYFNFAARFIPSQTEHEWKTKDGV